MIFGTRFTTVALLACTAALLSACEADPMPTPEPSPTVSITPSGDGTLKIGTVFSGAEHSAAVYAAAREINLAGGFRGTPVQVFSRSVGDADPSVVQEALGAILAQGVDVLIIPPDVPVGEELFRLAKDATVPLISPATVPDAEDAELLARLRVEDPGLGSVRAAGVSYDATIIAALAAVRAGDDGGASIRVFIPLVIQDGITCTSFGSCVYVLDTEPNISFAGFSGQLVAEESSEQNAGSYRLIGASAN